MPDKKKSISGYYSVEELKRELKYAHDLKTKWSHYIGEKTEVPCKMLVMLANDLIKMTTELMEWKGVKRIDQINSASSGSMANAIAGVETKQEDEFELDL